MSDPHVLKILVIGKSRTGKTNLVNKWTKNIFYKEHKPTTVSESGSKIFEKKGKLYHIQLWDLPNKDKNLEEIKLFAKDAHCVIILSDVNDYKIRQK